MDRQHENRILGLMDGYCENVKPLLDAIQLRHKDKTLPNNFLNEIRALNDHIARCYRDGVDDECIKKELDKAEGHERRLIYDGFKQMNAYIVSRLELEEAKSYSKMWLTYDNGQFWKDYTRHRTSAQKAVIEAKRNESVDSDVAMLNYEKAFNEYRKAEDLLLSHKGMLRWSRVQKWFHRINDWTVWAGVTVAGAVISSVICLFA